MPVHNAAAWPGCHAAFLNGIMHSIFNGNSGTQMHHSGICKQYADRIMVLYFLIG